MPDWTADETGPGMYLDVNELRDFYDRPLGATARRLIGPRVRARWSNVRGLSVFGLGYAIPYLGTFHEEARRVVALMPAAQGAFDWPEEGPVRTALIEDDALPLADHSVDRMLVVHALESCHSAQATLREIWRVLAPEGRLMVIVANRRGLWAQREITPFGHGQPYSLGQIERLLAGSMFTVENSAFALAAPPLELRALARSATTWERVGSRLWSPFSGVVMVEAVKQIAGVLPRGTPSLARVPLRVSLARPFGERRRAARHPEPQTRRDSRNTA
jgi:SAM-dependent methyltransferase